MGLLYFYDYDYVLRYIFVNVGVLKLHLVIFVTAGVLELCLMIFVVNPWPCYGYYLGLFLPRLLPDVGLIAF